MMKKKIGIIVGSARKESYNQKIANYLLQAESQALELTAIEIANLPLFNQDYDDEGTTPKEWIRFRETIASLDGFIFVTPEYNRSVPPLLKNAIDIASRPYGENKWDGKPGAIVSVSTGRLSGFGANHHLRQSATFLNIYMMQQPECYIGDVESLINEDGEITKDGIKKMLTNFLHSFAEWSNHF